MCRCFLKCKLQMNCRASRCLVWVRFSESLKTFCAFTTIDSSRLTDEFTPTPAQSTAVPIDINRKQSPVCEFHEEVYWRSAGSWPRLSAIAFATPTASTRHCWIALIANSVCLLAVTVVWHESFCLSCLCCCCLSAPY